MMIFVWVFASFGLAYVLGHAVITQAGREWAYARSGLWRGMVMLVECPACCGFWIGEITGYWLLREFWTVPLGIWAAFFLLSFVGGFFICATNYALARWTGLVPSAQDELAAELPKGYCDFIAHASEAYSTNPAMPGLHVRQTNCIRWRELPDFRGRST